MKLGARSLRGAMGTYTAAAALAVVIIMLVLHYGPSLRPSSARVVLPARAGWSGAVLRRGDTLLELAPGQTRSIAVGAWELRLFADDGSVEERSVELREDELREFGPAR